MKILLYIFTAVFLFAGDIISQTGSVYTRYGLGDMEYSYSARRLAMGNLGSAVSDYENIGILNPASWNGIKRTRMEFDLSYRGTFLSDGNLKKYHGKADFNGFTFAVPVSQQYGITAVLGLVPFTNINYEISQRINDINIGNYTVQFTGNGGLSKLFLGSSYILPFNFAVGATFDYYFGNLDYNTSLTYENSQLRASEYTRNYKPSGIGSTVGIISSDISSFLGTSSISDLKIGVALNYIGSLSTDTSLISTSVVGEDTIGTDNIDMEIPFRLTTGISFLLNKKFLLSLDYSFQQWSNYKFDNRKSAFLRNSFKLSSGFEYRPIRELGDTFWELFFWRAGLSFERTPYIVNGEGIDEFSVSGGFSLPMSPGNFIDVGIMYGMRGLYNTGLFKEDFIRMNVAISLGDIWFIRTEK